MHVAGFVARDFPPRWSGSRRRREPRGVPRDARASSGSTASTRARSSGASGRAERCAPGSRRRSTIPAELPRARARVAAHDRAAISRSRSRPTRSRSPTSRGALYHVAAVDYGMKRNIVRLLNAAGCRVTVFPAAATADAHPRLGPGRHLPVERPRRSRGARGPDRDDREARRQAADLRHLPRPPAARPRASARRTFKLKFGHRGANHPVEDLPDGRGRDHVPEPRFRRRRRRRCRPRSRRRTGT